MAGLPDYQLDELLVLAARLHGSLPAYSAFTLDSLRDHVAEVRALLAAEDPHWKSETVDIIIHCLLLLKSRDVAGQELDQLFDRRLGRFTEKIAEALRNRAGG